MLPYLNYYQAMLRFISS